MPYKGGDRLPPERASKLGHLDVLNSGLVQRLCETFEDPKHFDEPPNNDWEKIPSTAEPLSLIFGVDGSWQAVKSDLPPIRELAFVKTALLRLDQYALEQVDKDSPHPLVLRDILAESAMYHATVFPLRNVWLQGMSTYHAIRQIIFESVCDASLNKEPLETLKWIAYEKWDGNSKRLPLFGCPHCEENVATLTYDAEEGDCPSCHGHLFLTDMLGFHQDMAPDTASEKVAAAYMNIHETLLLFTGIRHYWENSRQTLSECLFIKDGPLTIRAQYSKLVAPIRRFFEFSKAEGHIVYLIGQEKTGKFADHLQLIGGAMSDSTLSIPGDKYIKEQIQHRPDQGQPYGKDTNYGAKVFVKLNSYHKMVLNVPTGGHKKNPKYEDLIGANRIFATLPKILSNRFEGALLPVELANGIASLSTYPSAHILKVFAKLDRH
jgi:hypothetical protein